MSALQERVAKAIHGHKLFGPGDRVLLAVSGGLDSMVLLHLLVQLSEPHDFELGLAHFNHQLRGRSSDADERLVRCTARELHLRLFVERGNVRGLAGKKRLSMEMAARTLRHEFLARLASQNGFTRVALAHHAGDQVELFFLRLLRGAGPEGMSGMKWISPSPADAIVKLVRPLLACSKADLAQYASENRVVFREDKTNACKDLLRNRIRHELLPLLRKSYQPAIDTIIPRLMEILRAENETVAQLALKALGDLTRAGTETDDLHFGRLPLAVQRRCLRLQLLRQGVPPEFDLVEQLRLQPLKTISAPAPALQAIRPVSVTRNLAGLVTIDAAAAEEFQSEIRRVELSGRAGQFLFDNVEIRWRLGPVRNPRPRVQPQPNYERFDADLVGRQIVVRHWQPGDRFQPIGTPSPSKLQDLFTNAKIPRGERHGLVLGLNRLGEIFWVQGLRISERFKLTKTTTRALHWRWFRA